jgi:flagellar hook-length control protein FliK
MAELLSMALLSAEPVSVSAKSQAVPSQDGTTEPDQSFAATLAAEVNGKSPEKPAKANAKTRQNTASEQSDDKEPGAVQATAIEQTKPQDSKGANAPDSVAADESEVGSAKTAQREQDEAQAEQSHWLNLLEKAKSLQERIGKSDKVGTITKGKPDDKLHQQQDAKLASELNSKLTAESEQNSASAESAVAAQTHTTSKQLSDKTKAADTLLADTTASMKPNKTTQADTAVASALDAKQLTELMTEKNTEKSTEQLLTAQELKALKLVTETDKAAAGKATTAMATSKQELQPGLKQGSDAQQIKALLASHQSEQTTEQASVLVSSELKSPEQQKQEHRLLKEGGLLQGKTIAAMEKSAEKPVKPTQQAATAELKDVLTLSEQQKIAANATEQTATTAAVAKVPQSAENLPSAQKNTLATSGQTDLTEKNTAETVTTMASDPDTKLSVQAQSAAAAVAPVTPQNKAPAGEGKITTEDVLKQAQTVSATPSDGGSSSSSGESQHQTAAEMLAVTAEPQKIAPALASEVNSFTSQLKSNLEKAGTGITVTGRELQTEQKQIDQLGQKLNLIQPEASNQLKDKMLLMVKDKVHTAEIRLDPSELGSMQIKINLQQDQMSVQFMVQQGNAKELMEQQMPKLRELLQQQGIELSQGSVQQQSQSSSGQEGGRRNAGGPGIAATLDGSNEVTDSSLIPARTSDRVVDYYA